MIDIRQVNVNNEGFGNQLVVLNRRDSEFFYHIVNP